MSASGEDTETPWLRSFRAGDRAVVEACYRTHFDRVLGAAKRVLGEVDAETVTHDVFYRLLSDPEMRASFRGGNLGAWLGVVAQRAAIDLVRRRQKEVGLDDIGGNQDMATSDPMRAVEEAEAQRLVERFKREVLPEKYRALFELRFLKQLSQREAARELGMLRTTLVYQEQSVRKLLEEFFLGGGSS